MHPMLQAMVRYLRAAKWVGNKSDLPHLLQKAQEAIGKGTLVQVFKQSLVEEHAPITHSHRSLQPLPHPPSQPATSEVQTVGSVLQQLSSTSSSSSSLVSVSASPLAQYMAKMGAKLPGDSGSQRDHLYLPSSGASLSQQVSQQWAYQLASYDRLPPSDAFKVGRASPTHPLPAPHSARESGAGKTASIAEGTWFRKC